MNLVPTLYISGITAVFALLSPLLDCRNIPNGRYQLLYNSTSSGLSGVVDIENGMYIKYRENVRIDSGQFVDMGLCYYRFASRVYTHIDTAGLAGLINRSFGPPCIEITEANNDTFFFRTTYSGNLHITQNSGRLVKVKGPKIK